MDEYPVDPNARTLPMDAYLVGPDDPTILMDEAETQPTSWPTHLVANTWQKFINWLTSSELGEACLVVAGILLLVDAPILLLWRLAIRMGVDSNHGLGGVAFTTALICYMLDFCMLPSLVTIGRINMQDKPDMPAWRFFVWPILLLVAEVAICVPLWVVAR